MTENKGYVCDFAYCKNTLETPDEVDMGLCSRHKDEIKSRYHTTLLCWQCNRLIETYHRREIIRGVEIPSEYLFTKTCEKCDKKASNKSLNLMTIDSSPAEPPTLIIKSGLSVRAGEILYETVKNKK